MSFWANYFHCRSSALISMITLAVTCSLVLVICSAISIPLIRRQLNKIRIVKLNSIWNSVLWTIRINKYKHPFPSTFAQWSYDGFTIEQIDDAWEFLRPFFVDKGYTLYERRRMDSAELYPCSAPAVAPASIRTYPFARTLQEDDEFAIDMGSYFVWGARDSLDRDVMIKLISDFNEPSNEWLILRKLNETELRSHPLNRTIHVLEFLVFDNLVFVVMPRWDKSFVAPFSTVSELMELTKSYLETLNFLHSHRIAHQDFGLGNGGMNVYGSHHHLSVATGVRDPKDVQYVVYDYGHSLLYPLDTDISTVTTSRFLRYFHGPDPVGPYKPFQSDVAMMAGMLFGNVMHAAKIVPEIEPFLYSMMDPDEDKRLTAAEALEAFMVLYDKLTPEQLQASVNSTWTNKFRSKLLPEPVYDD